MTLYAIQPKKSWFWVDSLESPSRETMSIIDIDNHPEDTGIVDQYGNPIVRVSPRIRAGFVGESSESTEKRSVERSGK